MYNGCRLNGTEQGNFPCAPFHDLLIVPWEWEENRQGEIIACTLRSPDVETPGAYLNKEAP